ncbi:hypothetical protein QBB31_25330 [Streptomyces scabiei]|uniref:hypothetical protein n=1 Tax=Streptomyces scabiei TaxID=1930 RepID=UPI002FF378D2
MCQRSRGDRPWSRTKRAQVATRGSTASAGPHRLDGPRARVHHVVGRQGLGQRRHGLLGRPVDAQQERAAVGVLDPQTACPHLGDERPAHLAAHHPLRERPAAGPGPLVGLLEETAGKAVVAEQAQRGERGARAHGRGGPGVVREGAEQPQGVRRARFGEGLHSRLTLADGEVAVARAVRQGIE